MYPILLHRKHLYTSPFVKATPLSIELISSCFSPSKPAFSTSSNWPRSWIFLMPAQRLRVKSVHQRGFTLKRTALNSL